MKLRSLAPLPALALGLLLAGCGGGDSSPAPAASSSSAPLSGSVVKVTMDPTNVGKFEPEAITVKAGDSVSWDFQDENPHTVTAGDGSFDSANKQKGESFTYKFTKPGTYEYHCSLHANMKGKVIVQ